MKILGKKRVRNGIRDKACRPYSFKHVKVVAGLRGCKEVRGDGGEELKGMTELKILMQKH